MEITVSIEELYNCGFTRSDIYYMVNRGILCKCGDKYTFNVKTVCGHIFTKYNSKLNRLSESVRNNNALGEREKLNENINELPDINPYLKLFKNHCSEKWNIYLYYKILQSACYYKRWGIAIYFIGLLLKEKDNIEKEISYEIYYYLYLLSWIVPLPNDLMQIAKDITPHMFKPSENTDMELDELSKDMYSIREVAFHKPFYHALRAMDPLINSKSKIMNIPAERVLLQSASCAENARVKDIIKEINNENYATVLDILNMDKSQRRLKLDEIMQTILLIHITSMQNQEMPIIKEENKIKLNSASEKYNSCSDKQNGRKGRAYFYAAIMAGEYEVAYSVYMDNYLGKKENLDKNIYYLLLEVAKKMKRQLLGTQI